jgi:hypothetical protein
MSLISPIRGRALVTLAATVAILALAFAAHASAASRTFNVNPATGKDSNSGAPTSPFKTLTKALSKARAGDTIQLAGGNYSQASGERFSPIAGQPTASVPSGVTIKGNTGAGLNTVLFGAPNQVGLVLGGSATIKEVTTVGFGLGLEASQCTQTLNGMHFTGGGIRLTGTASTTLTGQVHLEPQFRVDNGQTIFTGPSGATVSVKDQAQFTMTGGDIFDFTRTGDGSPNCDTTQKGIVASGSAHVTLNSVLLDDLAGGALDLTGTSSADVNGTKITDAFGTDSCVPLPAVRTLDSALLRVKNTQIFGDGHGSIAFADGIRALSRAPLSLTGSQVSGYSAHGILMGQNATSVQLSNSTLQGNGTQFDARAMSPGTSIVFTSDTVDNGGDGIIAPTLIMRNTEVTRTSHVEGAAAVTITGPHADLGTASSPGLNVFQGNDLTSVRLDPSITAGVIDAVGDVWEPAVQGANGFGIYNDSLTLFGGSPAASGRNFTLPGFGQRINLGPVGIGLLDLSPKVLRASAGGTARLVLAWTHPTDWHQLHSIQLLLYLGAQRIGQLTVWPHRARVTASGAIELVLGASRVTHRGRTVTTRLTVRFSRSLARRTVRVAVQATDVHGRRQLDTHAGVIRVRS